MDPTSNNKQREQPCWLNTAGPRRAFLHKIKLINTHLQVHGFLLLVALRERTEHGLGCKQRSHKTPSRFSLRGPRAPPEHPQSPDPHAGQGGHESSASPGTALAPTMLELPWLSLSKRNFRLDLGEFLFFRSAGGRGQRKSKNNKV